MNEAVQSDAITGNVVSPAANWSDNYQQFTAEFDPETLGGHYSYVWQAGRMDSHSRILNIGLEAVTAARVTLALVIGLIAPTGVLLDLSAIGRDPETAMRRRSMPSARTSL